jgi:ribose transport system permease protein
MIVFALTERNFLSYENLVNIIGQGSPLLIASLGMLIVIAGGGIDLSIGALMGLTGTIIALVLKAGYGLWIALAAGILVSGTCGLASGILIGLSGLPPMIVTFGMLYIAQGINIGITKGGSLTVSSPILSYIGREASFIFIPTILWIDIVLIIIIAILINYTYFGSHLYAVGLDTEGSRASGIRVKGLKTVQYILSGLLAGFAGCILASRLLTGNALIGIGTEFEAIAAVIVGGTPIIGGSGTVAGTIIGALIITTLKSGLNLYGLFSGSMAIIIGTSLMAMVVVARMLYGKRKAD